MIGLARSEQALADTFSTLDPPHRYIVGDLTSDAVYEELDRIDEPIDILVNNAGGDPHTRPWGHQTTQEWRDTYEINVIAAERLCSLLTPKMVQRGFGRVINVSSVYGSIGQDPRNTGRAAGAGAYTAAKHGLIGLTNYLACQLGATGVTVNTLSPGMITWAENPERRDRRALGPPGRPDAGQTDQPARGLRHRHRLPRRTGLELRQRSATSSSTVDGASGEPAGQPRRHRDRSLVGHRRRRRRGVRE